MKFNNKKGWKILSIFNLFTRRKNIQKSVIKEEENFKIENINYDKITDKKINTLIKTLVDILNKIKKLSNIYNPDKKVVINELELFIGCLEKNINYLYQNQDLVQSNFSYNIQILKMKTLPISKKLDSRTNINSELIDFIKFGGEMINLIINSNKKQK